MLNRDGSLSMLRIEEKLDTYLLTKTEIKPNLNSSESNEIELHECYKYVKRGHN